MGWMLLLSTYTAHLRTSFPDIMIPDKKEKTSKSSYLDTKTIKAEDLA